MSNVIRQNKHTKSELEAQGFKQYPRKKQLVMARQLPTHEAPLEIKTHWGETLIAQADYMICYDTGDSYLDDPHDYEHWPVDPNIFEQTYKTWDEDFNPTTAQQQLMTIGCKPFYKAVGIWAKSLDAGVYIQGMEHEKPVLVPEDRVLAIGAEGEPYDMGSETFHSRYDTKLNDSETGGLKKLVGRLIRFFKSE